MTMKAVMDELTKKSGNDFLLGLRQLAFDKLAELSLPDSSLEAWRKMPLRNFSPESFSSVSGIFSGKSMIDGVSLRFKNEISQGKMSISSFMDLSEKDKNFLQLRYKTLIDKYSNSYFALYALAYFTDGVLIKIADNFEIAESLKLDFLIKEPGNFFCPLVIVDAGKFSKLDLIETITSECTEPAMLTSLTDIVQAESSSVIFSAIENFDKNLIHFKTVNQEQAANSNFSGFHFHSGGNRGKTFYFSAVTGKGAILRLNGLSEMGGREFNDIEMRISHHAGDSASSIRYKTILSGKAHNVFTGNLYIPANLKHITASQINNNLLLQKTARAESIPGLEVFAEDIHCTHGATVGELDQELVFYLNSRGLDEKEAKSIIVGAFIASLIETHESTAAIEAIREILVNKGYNL